MIEWNEDIYQDDERGFYKKNYTKQTIYQASDKYERLLTNLMIGVVIIEITFIMTFLMMQP